MAALSIATIVAIGAVVGLAAPTAIGVAASPSAGAARAEYCPPQEKQRRKDAVADLQAQLQDAQSRLRTLQQAQQAARAQYFKKHRKAKDRLRFAKKQLAELKAAQAELQALRTRLKAAQAKRAACG